MSSAMLYAPFFGLRERPFNLVPDPDFLYWSDQHRRAFTVLEYGILSRAPITLVTGEIGSGKTTLVRALLATLGEDLTVGLVSNAQGGRGDLLSWVLGALGIEAPAGAGYAEMFGRLQRFLVDEYAAGRRVALIFDEAQNLSAEGIEELRLLTNINTEKDELVQLVLVGQPELRDIVRAPNMRQLAQRVAAAFHIGPMSPETVAEYLAHRLRHAGGTGGEFAPAAAARVAEASGGVPRLVNQLADMAMVYAWSAGAREVGPALVDAVLADGIFIWDAPDAPSGPTSGTPSGPSFGADPDPASSAPARAAGSERSA